MFRCVSACYVEDVYMLSERRSSVVGKFECGECYSVWDRLTVQRGGRL